MGIKAVPHPHYSPDLAPCDFWLLPKLSGCRYETIEEMKEAVTKVIDTLTQEDFHGTFKKLLERHNKCISAEGDYFEGTRVSCEYYQKKVAIRKKSGNLFNDPRMYNGKINKQNLKLQWGKKKQLYGYFKEKTTETLHKKTWIWLQKEKKN